MTVSHKLTFLRHFFRNQGSCRLLGASSVAVQRNSPKNLYFLLNYVFHSYSACTIILCFLNTNIIEQVPLSVVQALSVQECVSLECTILGVRPSLPLSLSLSLFLAI
jgi:hypothetical protein